MLTFRVIIALPPFLIQNIVQLLWMIILMRLEIFPCIQNQKHNFVFNILFSLLKHNLIYGLKSYTVIMVLNFNVLIFTHKKAFCTKQVVLIPPNKIAFLNKNIVIYKMSLKLFFFNQVSHSTIGLMPISRLPTSLIRRLHLYFMGKHLLKNYLTNPNIWPSLCLWV